MKKVIVFGTFDNLHPGHINFLQQARALGDYLIVSLAQDKIIEDLKSRKPLHEFEKRKKALSELEIVDQVIKGDMDLGAFRGVSIVQPDIIALGYDQKILEKALKDWQKRYEINIPIIKLRSFQPNKYKSSLLRDGKI